MLSVAVLIVGFLLLLSILVVIHESGHFIVAKLVGVKVEEFGVGFPPRLWGIRRGETVFTPGQMRALGARPGQKREVRVTVNVDNRAPGTEAHAQVRQDGNGNIGLDIVVEKIEGKLARNIERGDGLAPTLERRYGLNPAAGSF